MACGWRREIIVVVVVGAVGAWGVKLGRLVVALEEAILLSYFMVSLVLSSALPWTCNNLKSNSIEF